MPVIKTKIRKNKNSGFAIIEALVSILLFAIGIVGLLNMQAYMASATNQTKYRSEAIDFVNEITANIMMDKVGFASYADGVGNPTRTQWDNDVAKTLPNGSTSITINGQQVTVDVYWKGKDELDKHQYEVVTYVSYN